MKFFLKNTLPYFKKYLPVQFLALLFGLSRMIILLVTPQIVSLLVDRVINPLLGAESGETASMFTFLIEGIPADDYLSIFWVLAAALGVAGVLFFVCFYLKWHIAHFFALKSEREMRKDALAKIGSASGTLLAKYPSGDLILISTSDPRRIQELYTTTTQMFVDSIFYIATASYFLCSIDPVLLFLPILGGVISSVIIALFRKRTGKYYEREWQQSAEITTTVQESVYGVRTIASFAREDARRAVFARQNNALLDTYYDGVSIVAWRNTYTNIVRYTVSFLEIALTVWLGLSGKITAGEFTAVIGYMSSFMWQINSVLYSLNTAQRNFVSVKRFFGFLNDRDETGELYGSGTVGEKPHYEFKGVGVKSGEGYALQGVDLDLPYGKRLGIMGKTGSGKTLLVKLMQGFAEADEGELLIDGRPIHEYSRDELTRCVSYAMQDAFLFSNTISANIALYNPYAPEEEIRRAGALAEVDEFAAHFAEGYETTIGEKGFGLSGGQKQRISIARALFKNERVFVFDDVTSALDTDTEQKVFQNLSSEYGERTIVTVTHRAAALKGYDEIIFLDGGKITERGSFEELLALNGDFAEVYFRQSNEVACEE